MSTTIAVPAGRSPVTVGIEVPAAALMPGDLFLVEQHVVRMIRTGRREVAAIVLHCRLTLDGLIVIEWAGAVPGVHVSTGTAVYEAASPVTVLVLGSGAAA